MNEPVKEDCCKGCRAKSYDQCLKCAYLIEGIACQENIVALMEPIDFNSEVAEIK